MSLFSYFSSLLLPSPALFSSFPFPLFTCSITPQFPTPVSLYSLLLPSYSLILPLLPFHFLHSLIFLHYSAQPFSSPSPFSFLSFPSLVYTFHLLLVTLPFLTFCFHSLLTFLRHSLLLNLFYLYSCPFLLFYFRLCLLNTSSYCIYLYSFLPIIIQSVRRFSFFLSHFLVSLPTCLLLHISLLVTSTLSFFPFYVSFFLISFRFLTKSSFI